MEQKTIESAEPRSGNTSPRMRRDVVLMMVVGVMMWVGTPLLWLYVGSMIKVATDNLNLAIIVMFIGAIISIALLIKTLGALNDSYFDQYEELNDVPMERSPLEPILVFSAVIAVTAFFIWFSLVGGNATPMQGSG